MKTLFLTVILLSFTAVPALAQFHTDGKAHAEINFLAGIPEGELDEFVDGGAVGLSVLFGGRVPNSRLTLGTELGYLNYGTDSDLRLHSTVFDAGIDDDLAVPLEAVTTSVTNNLFLGHLVARFHPIDGVFQPYVDVLGGLKYFDTRLSVDSDVVIFRRGLDQDAHVTDFAFSYGFGGGFELEVYEHRSVWNDEGSTVSLHAGLRYLLGSRARIASEGSVQEIDEQFIVYEVRTRTNMLLPQFGIRVRP